MTSLRRQILLKAFKAFDLLIMVFAFALATWVMYYHYGTVSFAEFLSMRVKVQNFILFLGFLWAWHMVFSAFGLYHSRRLSTRWAEIIDVMKATSLGTLTIFIASILFRIEMITPVFLAVFWAGSSGIAISSRFILRYMLAQIRQRGRNLRYMLIVGTNPRSLQFAEKIEAKPELGYNIIGFVDDEWEGIGEFLQSRYSLVAHLNDFSTLLKEYVVDEVVIGLPMKSFYDHASRIVELSSEQGIIVRFLSRIFNLKLPNSEIDRFEEELVVTVYKGAMDGWPALAKRIFDFSLAMTLTFIFSPLFLITALLIKITSQGPVFFVQTRLGLNKRPFKIIKFRTMVKDADKTFDQIAHLNQEKGPAFKIKSDPRITPLGRFLRKKSIDELPQLINVLKGDMSLVGPRPLFEWEFNRIEDPWIKRRCSVKPGLTGLWQVAGRSNVTFDRRIQMDLEYIDNWSLFLDFQLLIKTIPIVLLGKGAV